MIRRVPLVSLADGNDLIIVASKGGAPKHPAWYENLVANPDCEIRVGATRLQARARIAAADERVKGAEGLIEEHHLRVDGQCAG